MPIFGAFFYPMKLTTLFSFLLLLGASFVQAQNCKPGAQYRDSTFGVFPRPYNDSLKTGGIDKPVCLNEAYELVFTIKPTDSIAVNGNQVKVNYFRINEVLNLPPGLTYACHPATCQFAIADTIGCLVVRGTVTDPTAVGKKYKVTIKGIARVAGFFDFPLEFPGAFAPGVYEFEVRAQGACTSSASSLEALGFEMLVAPNPSASTEVSLQVFAPASRAMHVKVLDLQGRSHWVQSWQVHPGRNVLQLPASQWTPGFYQVLLWDAEGNSSSTKLLIQE